MKRFHHHYTVVEVKNKKKHERTRKEHILVRPTCEAITDVPRRAVEWSVIYYNGFFVGRV